VLWPDFDSNIIQAFFAPCAVNTPPENSYEKQQERTRWNRTVEGQVALYRFFHPVEKQHTPRNQKIRGNDLCYRRVTACVLRFRYLSPEYSSGQQRKGARNLL